LLLEVHILAVVAMVAWAMVELAEEEEEVAVRGRR